MSRKLKLMLADARAYRNLSKFLVYLIVGDVVGRLLIDAQHDVVVFGCIRVESVGKWRCEGLTYLHRFITTYAYIFV